VAQGPCTDIWHSSITTTQAQGKSYFSNVKLAEKGWAAICQLYGRARLSNVHSYKWRRGFGIWIPLHGRCRTVATHSIYMMVPARVWDVNYHVNVEKTILEFDFKGPSETLGDLYGIGISNSLNALTSQSFRSSLAPIRMIGFSEWNWNYKKGRLCPWAQQCISKIDLGKYVNSGDLPLSIIHQLRRFSGLGEELLLECQVFPKPETQYRRSRFPTVPKPCRRCQTRPIVANVQSFFGPHVGDMGRVGLGHVAE